MPIVSVSRDLLFQKLEKTFTLQEFEDLCFDFGIELDDVTSEKEMVEKMKGNEAAKGLSEEVIYKIDIPANRYDLLCLEGLSRGLRVFLKLQDPPVYKVNVPSEKDIVTLRVKPETSPLRPFCVSAVIRGICFDENSFQSFIELQEKLHTNICRGRTLVAIGTHDLDTLQGPFSYECRPPKDIKFVPLKEDREFDGDELFQYYREKPQCELKKFLPIIEDSDRFPVIYDSNGVVCSLPPIINGEHSKITIGTQNVFIECTATDRTKAAIVLNTVCCMFSEYASEKFAVEAVRVEYEADSRMSHISPDLSDIQFEASVSYINSGIGIDISAEEMCDLLTRMQLRASVDPSDPDKLIVLAPPTRSDILHPCDILEDVAIAYGFNRVPKTVPGCATIGRQQSVNVLSDLLRRGMAEAGFIEVLTWALVSRQENFANMRLEEMPAVSVGNPKTVEFEIVRTSLLPGLLKTLGHNRAMMQLPVKLFELSDVALLDESNAVGARNERRLSLLHCGRSSGFEVIHGALDRIMALNNVAFGDEGVGEGSGRPPIGRYTIESCECESFLPKLRADVMFCKAGANGSVKIGSLGVLHPDVLKAFSIDSPCAALEVDLTHFV